MTKYESIKRDMKQAMIEHNHEAMDKMRKNPHIYIERYLSSDCLLYTSPSPRDVEESRMPSSA